jgi:hypothetical protein
MSTFSELFQNGPLLDVMLDFSEEVVSKARSNIRINQTKYGRKRKANTTGRLAASLSFDLNPDTGTVKFVSSEPYAGVIEFGARGSEELANGISKLSPGPLRPHSEKILEWMNNKNIRLREKTATGSKFTKESPAARRSVAYAIAQSIHKKGFSPLEYFQDAYKETLPEYRSRIAQALADSVNIAILDQSRTLTNIKPQ